MYPLEVCCLAHLNLPNHIENGEMNWTKLAKTIAYGVRFLDNVLEAGYLPFPEMKTMTQNLRRIGLGVAGLADAMAILGIPYGETAGEVFAQELFHFIRRHSDLATHDLAIEKGDYLLLKEAIQATFYSPGTRRRNVTTLCAAPTGTTTMAAGLFGYSIEPFFGLAYLKNTPDIDGSLKFSSAEKKSQYYLCPYLPDDISDRDMQTILTTGMTRETQLPDAIKSVFVTARELRPLQAMKVQAAIQRYVDNSVSRTYNTPNSTRPEDIGSAFELAYELGCKSMTVFREGCLDNEIIKVGTNVPNSDEEDCDT